MPKSFLFFLTLCLAFLCSCQHRHESFEVFGADEFVMDSYVIAQGKKSILEMQGQSIRELGEEELEEFEDQISSGDVLKVSLYHPSNKEAVQAVNLISQTLGYPVNNGWINLPDLPEIYVSGLTLEQARKKIEDLYLEQIQDVEVFLSYADRNVKKVSFMGMCNLSELPVDGKLRIFDALAQVKIHPFANLHMSYIERKGHILNVDLHKLVQEGDMSQNIVLQGGDHIYIADSGAAKVMIMGEVGSPTLIALPSGSISLREALVSSGGLPFTANKHYIQVIRGEVPRAKIYTLDWHMIVHLPNQSLLLMPGDTVYVSAKAITQWNRFISQILPSLDGVHKVKNTTQVIGIR